MADYELELIPPEKKFFEPFQQYRTTNTAYGETLPLANESKTFQDSTPYKSLLYRRTVRDDLLPSDKRQVALVQDPEHPCGICTVSNVPRNTPLGEVKGEFTNVRRDLYTDPQGLWSNGMFNTAGATIDRDRGTYSNLQGGWARVGPSMYDATHGCRDWVNQWGTTTFEPSTLRSLRDHPNVNPRHNQVPIESTPQQQQFSKRP